MADENNIYQAPKSSADSDLSENRPSRRSQYIFAGSAISVLHFTSVLLPLSLYSPGMVADMLTFGQLPLGRGEPWLAFVPLTLLIAKVIALIIMHRLVYRWRHRSRLFFIAALGVTITFVCSCLFGGAVWDLVLAIVFWVVLGNRRKEFISKPTPVAK